ncbi:Transmembrane protein 41 homolog [Geodia barretti]|uniref:Transmembrane protein 41 homolog n=1 Tax=Geodia barretti TaxID=519541 RepID=A0AA35TX42_GEOBA|nr:Transmembrane protein 41 homolog [Geodia barretti]
MERRRLRVDENTTTREVSSSISLERSDGELEPREHSNHVTRPGLSVAVIFVASVCAVSLVLYNCPDLDEEDSLRLKWPRDLDSVKELARLLSKYKNTHYFTVLSAVFIIYILLVHHYFPQRLNQWRQQIDRHSEDMLWYVFTVSVCVLFCVTLQIDRHSEDMLWYVFTVSIDRHSEDMLWYVFTVSVCVLFCVTLQIDRHSEDMLWYVFTVSIDRHSEDMLWYVFTVSIDRHSEDMLWYVVFLRITPFLPNWFINLASPIVGVRIPPFFWGTFLGVAPPSFFFVRAGTTPLRTDHQHWPRICDLSPSSSRAGRSLSHPRPPQEETGQLQS